MKYKRIKRGSFKNMTPDEQRAHRLMLQRRWRANNRDKLRAHNHYYWELYKKTKPTLCVCQKCGKEFYAPRKNYCKRCDDCRALAAQVAAQNREKVQAQAIRAQEKRAIRAKILKLARAGVKQIEISRLTGYPQSSVATVCIRNGIRRRPQRSYRKQA